jgi:hypothetical protein
MAWSAQVVRQLYRRELFPTRVLWWLAAEGMRDFFRQSEKFLAAPLAEAGATAPRALLATLGARMFARRWPRLRELPTGRRLGRLPDGERTMALTMAALYRIERAPRLGWIFDAVGGPPTPRERLRALWLLGHLDVRARWEEVAGHLGELLIVFTEELPPHLPHARKLLGDMCFTMGVRTAKRARRAFDIPATIDDPPRAAMEILRMSEYVFRVNPEHWSDSDRTHGFLEGTACPWYTRPGWNGAHCGIFGQFQSGIASEFGLRYHLTQTIPKHGGTTCRIDLKPIPLGKRPPTAPSPRRE